MNSLAEAVDQYIQMRRSLGFRLGQTARELPRFVAFLERERADFITTHVALRWALEDPDSSPVTRSDRLCMVRRFARWRSAADPRTEAPPHGLIPRRYQRPAPYIYSDAQVESIVSYAKNLPSQRGIRGLTCSALFGLLAVTGMRISEAVALDDADVDLSRGVITIRHGKRGKARFVPIHKTTAAVLASYSEKVVALLPRPKPPAFFISDSGRRMSAWSAGDNFVKVTRSLGIRGSGPSRRRGRGPRLHDFRHLFAVSTLIRWYRAGVDVDREIPKLATFLGHDGVNEVYWYLQAVPELLQAATDSSRLKDGAS